MKKREEGKKKLVCIKLGDDFINMVEKRQSLEMVGTNIKC